MHRAAAALIAIPGTLLAHPGHDGLEGHFHGLGIEHALLIAVVIAFLLFAVKKQ